MKIPQSDEKKRMNSWFGFNNLNSWLVATGYRADTMARGRIGTSIWYLRGAWDQISHQFSSLHRLAAVSGRRMADTLRRINWPLAVRLVEMDEPHLQTIHGIRKMALQSSVTVAEGYTWHSMSGPLRSVWTEQFLTSSQWIAKSSNRPTTLKVRTLGQRLGVGYLTPLVWAIDRYQPNMRTIDPEGQSMMRED